MHRNDSTSGVLNPASGVKTTKRRRHERLAALALSAPHAARQTPHAKAGFSLIEILVVMGIIAFLTAAIVVIMPRVANASKVAATKATIRKVDELLNDRINGFVRYIQTQNTIAAGNPPSYVTGTQYAAYYAQNPQLYQFLAAKQAFKNAFPQNFQEAGTKLVPTNPALHKPVTESAACLYVILTTAGIFDTEPPAAGDLRGLEVADTDGDGLMEIVDAWGNPLQYYRWPTRLFRPATSPGSVETAQASSTTWNVLEQGPAPTPASILVSTAPRGPLLPWNSGFTYTVGQAISPANLQPGNVMMYQCGLQPGQSGTSGTSGGTQPNWTQATSKGAILLDGSTIQWTAVLDPLAIDSDDPNGLAPVTLVNETTFHTWATYHVPLIVSAGTDGNLGLYQPWDTSNFGTLAQPEFNSAGAFNLDVMYDNITNHQ